MSDVTAAYRLMLGRAPDKSGLASYKQLIAHGITVEQLFQTFLDSDEYKNLREQKETIQAVDCGGYYVCVNPSEVDFGHTILHEKTWEPHIVQVLSSILSEGDTFIDIGANVGVMTFLGAKLVGPSGSVVAIEPNPSNLQLLYAGIVKNQYEHVRVLPFAASDSQKLFSLNGGSSNSYLTAPEQGRDYVQSVALDTVLQDLESIDLVKIDIEGHEPFAIEGFRKLLVQHKPQLLMEFNPRCLRDVSGLTPLQCLVDIFQLVQDVVVIEHLGRQNRFHTAQDVWEYWQKQNEQATASGRLAEGMLHFDLLAKLQ